MLKQCFGYDSFLPLQEIIITEAIEGKDVLAILPTGAGKSLCFQIPSLIQGGTTIVISPLIALMRDQVAFLKSNGIAATFLNSSLSDRENQARQNQILNGEIRIVYFSPERLCFWDFPEQHPELKIDLIAIDEAHCISEWGHDFRPEYRQLSELRDRFRDVPLMALTATATKRVRDDIQSILHLNLKKIHISSFGRKNLIYRVTPKRRAVDQIIMFLKSRERQPGIIYCQSRKSAERLAQTLCEKGFDALPYHAGLSHKERSQNQDAFIGDACQIICATIAFGMGIDKPNIRFVIHHDLPKNIESYYQETGRAGRDGLEADCLLLFRASDVVHHHRFISQKTIENERSIAHRQLQKIVDYAENDGCRRTILLGYFGETPANPNCQACDNCLQPKTCFDGRIPAQKALSCIYRVSQKSGFAVGISHIAKILIGANTKKIRNWQHHLLSPFGIGKEFSQNAWSHILRQLIRKGFIRQDSQSYNTLHLTSKGIEFLKQKPDLMLIHPPKTDKAQADPMPLIEEKLDSALFEELRNLRTQLASKKGVPAYIIFSDATLRHISRCLPQTYEELIDIHGIGNSKLHEYGSQIIKAVKHHIDHK